MEGLGSHLTLAVALEAGWPAAMRPVPESTAMYSPATTYFGFRVWGLKPIQAQPMSEMVQADSIARYRATSLIRNCHSLGPYSRPVPRTLWWSWGEGLFRMSKVPLYTPAIT